MRKRFPLFVFSVSMLFSALACSLLANEQWVAPVAEDQLPASTATPLQSVLIFTATAMPEVAASPTTVAAPTNTPTAVPTNTSVPTPTATETPPPTVEPTPTHPLMIEVMRQQTYPGSEITVERQLADGANYSQYVVSYLSEGNQIFALLTIPFGETPPSGWPVVIFNHGYIPPEVYQTTERYVAYVDYFARNGYIVFKSDYRGHGNSEGNATGGYSTPNYTIDVLNGMASVKTLAEADPERIGMWGHSMGGQITLRAMVVNDEIKAGVIWAGVIASYPDIWTYWRRADPNRPTPTPNPNPGTFTRGRWRTQLFDTYGDFDENPEFWAAVSPNSYLDEISGPVQLHHGTGDTVVPIILSDLLAAELDAAGVENEYYVLQGDDHNISQFFTLSMQRSLAFFDEHVKGQ